jgi:acyl-CoA thioesterase-2
MAGQLSGPDILRRCADPSEWACGSGILSGMGDLAADTAVEACGEGRYSAALSPDWEIWGPMGGYVAAIALRAAGDTSSFARPASFFCHYLGVATFDRIDLQVTMLRAGRSAMSQRVTVTQGDRAILEATIWSADAADGLEHEEYSAPRVPGPDDLQPREQAPDAPTFAFWDNVEMKPVRSGGQWPPDGPLPPVWQAWCRFRPTATFAEDPWLDASRSVILVDVQSWPANSQHHAWKKSYGFIAPSLDLYVAFHRPVPEEQWLLADGYAPVSRGGMFGWTGRIWTTGGSLVASGAGQALYKRVPVPDSTPEKGEAHG